MGDEHEAAFAFVDAVFASGGVCGVAAPLLEVLAGGVGQQVRVGGDGQAPVVGEGQDRVFVRDAMADGGQERLVGLDAPEEETPGRGAQEASGFDAADPAGLLVFGQVQGLESAAGGPCLAEPARVRDAP
ncbi:hypothetical protein [Streptomyces sp. NPDC048248]|uniref:hypothetical protein n=1 Tax=Streptomyces sp. NPDC048248 TaxID=3365523 RepID=UPI0037156F99